VIKLQQNRIRDEPVSPEAAETDGRNDVLWAVVSVVSVVMRSEKKIKTQV